jgi:hypothetical protein
MSLRADWLAELEAEGGFSHAILVQIVEQSLANLVTLIEIGNHQDFQVREFWQSSTSFAQVTVGDVSYVIMLYPRSLVSNFGLLYLFRVVNNTAEVIEFPRSWFPPYEEKRLLIPNPDDPPIGDINLNGHPDFVVQSLAMGSGGYRTITVIEIRDGGVVNITPDGDLLDWGHSLGDINSDGLIDIRTVTPVVDVPLQWVNCCEPDRVRWYGWDGNQYVDISSTLSEAEYPVIDDYWNTLQTSGQCPSVERNLFTMLFAYESLGRLLEGWERTLTYAVEHNCILTAYDEVEVWVDGRLNVTVTPPTG